MKPTLLIVDDEVNFSESLAMALENDFAITMATSLGEARTKLGEVDPVAMLLDVRLPDGAGVELFQDLKALPQMPIVVVMTAYGTIENAVTALKEGAVDYVVKPFDIDKLKRGLTIHLENRMLHRKIGTLSRQISKIAPPFTTTGTGRMKELMEKVAMVAPLNIPVLITGETGTGKEKLAQWLHELSGRSEELVSINCATLPKELMESELFGYARGAFSGAVAAKEGLIEKADNGTLFLDEIGELPEPMQAKLLRVLENGVYYKLGETRERVARFRLVSATNRDIHSPDTFREDLYYRINGIPLDIPPLRERRDDIPLLVSAFIREANYAYQKQVTGVSEESRRQLVSYPWPGNIRELKWCINRAVAIASGEVIQVKDIALSADRSATVPSSDAAVDFSIPFETAMEALETAYIRHALASAGNNKTEAAKILGISVRTLHYKIEKYRLQ
jgi:DNA-binding NtrC family response regulator